MAIKEVITLEGVDQVKAQLKDLGNIGEASLNQFRQIGGSGQENPFDNLVKNAQDAGLSFAEVEKHTNSLREAIHVLHPILQAAGLQMTELGSFARLAGASVEALGIAFVGAVVVGLAKLEENAARTKGQLTDLFSSSGKGEQAFGALAKQAGVFGTTVEGLAPGLESFQAALNSVDRTAQGFRALKEEDLPGAQLAKNADAVSAAYGNFIKLLRAGRLDQDQAEKSAKAFFDTMKEGGTVTSSALKNLPTGTINLLKDAFGQAGLTSKQFFALVDTGAISVDALEKALINFGPRAQNAFDTKAIKTFSDELSKTFSVLKEGFKDLTGTELSDFLNNQIKLFRLGLQGFLADLKAIKDFVRSGLVDVLGEPAAKATFAERFDALGSLGDALQKLPPKFLDANNSLQKLGAAGLLAGTQAASGIDKANAEVQKLRDLAKVTGQELQDVVIGSTRFTGRLNQIQVFQPQLAGEVDLSKQGEQAGTAAGKATGAKFVEAVNSELEKSDFVQPVTKTFSGVVQQSAEAGDQSGQGFFAGLGAQIPGALALFQSLYNSVVSVFSTPIPWSLSPNPFLAQQPTGLATGGMVRGAGSTTSDSILALLSNREFVVNARAVSHYGPDFFAALNAMRLPRDFLSRFSMGGLARSLGGNRFAAGGQVRAGNPVVLKIDRQSFNMTAGDDTIAQLKRFAVTAQLSSSGRKPRWVR